MKKVPPLLNMPGKVRLIKDCLRVGRWYLGDDENGHKVYWNVTRQTLDELVANFNSQLAAGHFHPLQWGHPAPIPGNSEQVSIEYIRHLWRDEDMLFFGVYVTPAVAAKLMEKHRQVSVRVIDEFHTEASRRWGQTLIHVAIVDHGAVPMQMPFVELSAKTAKFRKLQVPRQSRFIQLSSTVSPPSKGKTMDPELKKLLTSMDKKLDRVIAGLELEEETEDIDAMTVGEAKELTARLLGRKTARPSASQKDKARKLLGLNSGITPAQKAAAKKLWGF